MRNANRRGLMAMETIDGSEELGPAPSTQSQLQPEAAFQNREVPPPEDPENIDHSFVPCEDVPNGLDILTKPIEDINFFEGEMVPGEFPEVDEEVNIIATLESQLLDLSYLEDDLRRAGGMSQHFALEAQKLIPDFDGKKSPSYYSQEPTATRYKVAMEEITDAVWALIGIGIATVLALFAKLYFWITGRKKKNSGGGGGDSGGGDGKSAPKDVIKEATEFVEKMPAAVKEYGVAIDLGMQVLHKADALLAHSNITLKNEYKREYSVRSFQDIINNVLTNDERMQESRNFLDTRTKYVDDIIHVGGYTKELMEVVNKVAAAGHAISLKASALDKVCRKDINSHNQEDGMENSASMDVLKRSVEINLMGHQVTLKEAAQDLDTKRKALKEEWTTNPITFDKLFTSMSSSYQNHTLEHMFQQTNAVMKTINDVNAQLDQLQRMSLGPQFDGTPGALKPETGGAFRNVLSFVQDEVKALNFIMQAVIEYFKQLTSLAQHSLNFAILLTHKATVAMGKQKQTPPAGWVDISKELTAQRNAITKVYADTQAVNR